MATVIGTAQTYGLNTGLMLDFEPLIALLDPFDVPLQGGQGADGSSALATGNAYEVKVSWQDEASLTPRTVLGAAAVTADVQLTITAGEGNRFQTDDIILVDTELMRVTGYSVTTADIILVSRAFNSTTAASHANTTAVLGVGSAPIEGADPPAARARDRVERINYCQIFGPYAITVSGTEQVVRKFGLSGTEFDRQAMNRTKELSVAVEQAALYGTPLYDSANQRRTMGGLINYINVNVDTTTTTLTESSLLGALQTCFDQGGNPDRLISGSKQKRVISAFTSAGVVQVMRPDNQRGVKVTTFISDFGEVSCLLDRWMRTQDLFVFNRDQAELLNLRNMHFEPLAKTGDSEKGMVIGEKTMRFRRSKHAFKYTALT